MTDVVWLDRQLIIQSKLSARIAAAIGESIVGIATDGIFISYRRNDVSGYAGRLYDRLCEHFGIQRVFRDMEGIAPGTDFMHVLHEKLDLCKVLIVMMGPAWNKEIDRLNKPDDIVRLEIERAIHKQMLIMPVLVQGAQMPSNDSLPSSVSALANRQAFELSDSRFNTDVDLLIEHLKAWLAANKPQSKRQTHYGLFVLVAAIIGLLIVSISFRHLFMPVLELRSTATVLTADQAKVALIQHNLFDANMNPEGDGLEAQYRHHILKNEIVFVDSATKLMWHAGSKDDRYTFEGAKRFVDELNKNRHAGFEDWRVPTLEEAMSIMRPEVAEGWHLPEIFGRQRAGFIWTADRKSPELGWLVYYIDGDSGASSLAFHAYVRAVRSQANGL